MQTRWQRQESQGAIRKCDTENEVCFEPTEKKQKQTNSMVDLAL